MLCDFPERQKAGQGERLKFSFEGLDVLGAFSALRQYYFFEAHLFVANIGPKRYDLQTGYRLFDQIPRIT
ncbi:MAG: hypothetical protein IPM81_18465 [Saprospirales bacterium]|nr:hypothetical protein [Saprospirales bacterium]